MTIAEKFKELKKKKEGALIGFVTVGYPGREATIKIVNSLLRGGVDIIELGLPFSDPIADGLVIQKASEAALKAGMNPDLFFEIAKKIKGVPKVCLTYYNLVLQRGLEKFVRDCQESGISGLIIPDLPIEEAKPLLNFCHKYQTDLIFLVAQTTTETRLKKILQLSRGFLYVVSLLGVTGAREKLSESIKPLLAKINRLVPPFINGGTTAPCPLGQEAGPDRHLSKRRPSLFEKGAARREIVHERDECLSGKLSTKIPLAVGFGISKLEHVKEVLLAGADGVIVGSALIKLIEKNLDNKKKMLLELENFVRKLKGATKSVL